MPPLFHPMRSDSQIYQLNRPFNLCVNILDLAELGAGKHIFDIAPPIALLADFLQYLASFLQLFPHSPHL